MNDHVTIDLGGYEGILVPAQDVERFSNIDVARRLLREAHATPVRELRELARSSGCAVTLEDDDEVIDSVAEMLASGRYVILRTSRPHANTARRPGKPTSDDWSDVPLLSELRPTRSEPPPPTWIEIRCVGRRGESYGGSRVRIRMPDGELRELRLDDGSRVRIDDIEDGGTCYLEMTEDAKRRRHAPRVAEAGLEASGTILPGGTPRGVRTAAAHTLLVEDIPYAHSW